jgi:hypothetical protein
MYIFIKTFSEAAVFYRTVVLTLVLSLGAFCSSVSAQTTVALRKEIEKSIPDAQKEIVSIGMKGISPRSLTISKLDASVFFLNKTKSDRFSLEIDFGKNRVHCSSPNLELGDDGVMRTKEPLRPKDFAIMCFPQAGSYSVLVTGLEKPNEQLRGEIVIVDPSVER